MCHVGVTLRVHHGLSGRAHGDLFQQVGPDLFVDIQHRGGDGRDGAFGIQKIRTSISRLAYGEEERSMLGEQLLMG
jgi:hypothetical protein